MHEGCRTRSYAVVLTAFLYIAAPWAAADGDPYRTDALVPPNHYSSWPEATAPDPPAPALEVAPDTSLTLTLAQLTDLALRNNPRTRQAWAAARFEAAQYGVAKSSLLPQID